MTCRQTRITPVAAVALALVVIFSVLGAVASSSQGYSVPAPEKLARAWISKDFHNARAMQAEVTSSLAVLARVGRRRTAAGDVRAIEQAQRDHEALYRRFYNFYVNASDSGRLGDAEDSVASGGDDLDHAMGALVAYLRKPTAVTLRTFERGYENGLAGWDEGLRSIYGLARESGAPTISYGNGL